MQIEVGEFVRDCDGIIIKVNEIQEYKEDDDIWYEETTLKGTWKSMVVKHSKNIIDLIEVGDYVNGYKVTKVGKYSSDYPDFMIGETYIGIENKEYWIYEEEKIKSIVTKEQFKSVEYII